jgi:hypothetical protein
VSCLNIDTATLWRNREQDVLKLQPTSGIQRLGILIEMTIVESRLILPPESRLGINHAMDSHAVLSRIRVRPVVLRMVDVSELLLWSS